MSRFSIRCTFTRLSYLALGMLLACLLTSTATAQPDPPVRYLSSGLAVAVDAYGHVFVTGFTMTLEDGRDTGERAAFLARFDSDGQQQWLKFIGRGTVSSASDLVVAADGYIYVIGYTNAGLETNEAIDHQAFLSKFDQQGEQIWYRQFGEVRNSYAQAVTISPDGDVLVAVREWQTADDDRRLGARLTKYSAAGQLLWERRLNEDDFRFIRDLTTDSHGNIFVAGSTRPDTVTSAFGSSTSNSLISKYDPDGGLVWHREFIDTRGTSAMHHSLEAIAIDEARQRLYVAGWQTIDRHCCITPVRPDATAAFLSLCPTLEEQLDIGLFGMRVDYSEEYEGRDIVVDDVGNVVVVGWMLGGVIAEPLGLRDAFVISFNAEGEQRWAHLLGTSESDEALGVAVDQDNAIYITGFLEFDAARSTRAGQEVFLAKYHPDGQQLWLQTFTVSP